MNRLYTYLLLGSFLLGFSASSFAQTGTPISGDSSFIISDDGDYYIAEDCKANIVVNEGVTAVLDLNGKTLTYRATAATNNFWIIQNKGNLVIKDTSTDQTGKIVGISSVASSYGMAIRNEQGSVIMEGGTITGFKTKIQGGPAIYNMAGASFTFMGGLISNCSFTQSVDNTNYGGGGAVLNAGTFTIDGGTFDNCYASVNPTTASYHSGGGAIYNNGELFMKSGLIANCSATTTTAFTSSQMGPSKARGGGGVLSIGNFTMSGGTIDNCKISSGLVYGAGGGILMTEDGEFTMSDGVVSNCTAGTTATACYGGGVSVFAARFTGTDHATTTITDAKMFMTGGTITSNSTAGYAGGGIAILYGYAKISGGTITKNSAGWMGGGICVGAAGEIVIDGDVEISYNSVTGKGTLIDDNDRGGGGFCLGKSGVNLFTMTNGKIFGNTSDVKGGGIYLRNGVNDVLISGGDIYENTGTYGGGLYTYGTVTMTGGYIHDNIAKTHGGGLYLNGAFSMSGGTIEGNEVTASTGNGGGVFVAGNASLTGGTIKNNTVLNRGGGFYSSGIVSIEGEAHISGNNAKEGGGFFVTNSVATNTVISGGVIISNNTASSKGGGAYIAGAGCKILDQSTQIVNNNAQYGGGLYISATKTTTLSAGLIQSNIASASGGAIYSDKGTLNIEGSRILSNTATLNGGAIFSGSGGASKITMTDGEISNNQAVDGAGIYNNISTSTITYNGGSISNNEASGNGGAIYIKAGTITVNGGNIIENTAAANGAGIYMTTGTSTINGGNIIGNTATANGAGIYMAAGTNTISGGNIMRNKASINGAGIYMAAGTNTVQGGNIYANISSGDGAGIYMAGGKTNLYGGKIDANIATNNGGGLYAKAGTILFNKQTGSTDHGSINGNTAKNGGGVYITGSAALTFTDGLISGNKAVSSGDPISTAYQSAGDDISGVGGGVYIGTGTSSSYLAKVTFNTASGAKVGVYQNYADNAADDLFANAKYTSVIIPLAENMELSEYSGVADGWYADYVTDDTQYSQGIFTTGAGVRFRNVSRESAVKLTSTLTTPQQKKYICLALGIKYNTLTITKTGLKKGESALFVMTNPNVSTSRKVILTGVDDSGSPVSVKYAKIESGEWTVAETDWSWTYTPDSATKTVTMGSQDMTLSFDNTKRLDIPSNDEAIKQNIFTW